MKLLDSNTSLEAFFSHLAEAKSRVLLLDYDGTIAPFHPQRELARPDRAVAAAINDLLAAQHTRVVLISGRAIDDLIPLLADFSTIPEIWGSHGWEHRLADGTCADIPLPSGVPESLANARTLAAKAAFLEQCEIKPASIAVHWRGLGAAKQSALMKLARETWGPISNIRTALQETDSPESKQGLEWHEFDGGIELRVPGRNKGDAVRSIVDEEDGDTVIAYAGDDFTDEDAFSAIADHGLSILVRTELRNTCAKIWLESHKELADFLTRWNDACIREP